MIGDQCFLIYTLRKVVHAEQVDLPFLGSAPEKYVDDFKKLSSELKMTINLNFNENLGKIGLKPNVICGSRMTVCKPTEVKMKGKNIKFTLRKSSYATMLLRELSMGGVYQ